MDIIPAIDLRDGRCVRLEKGDFATTHQVAADAAEVARAYRAKGARLIHVVDLDGAKDGVRRNSELVRELVRAAAPARVELGGGLRSIEDIRAADALGVRRFVLGSAAVENPELLSLAVAEFGERIAVGIDAKDGVVRTRGWLGDSGLDFLELAKKVSDMGVKTIIFTDIDTDGMLSGPPVDSLKKLREACGCEIVASGGVGSPEDIRTLRKLGVDACIVGKALYSGDVELADAFFEARCGALFDKSELVPAVIQNADTREVLMLGYMSRQSLRLTLETRRATFFSRSRQKLWVKGEASGNFLHVSAISSDCDEDALLLLCRPDGPTCHTGSATCFFREVLQP